MMVPQYQTLGPSEVDQVSLVHLEGIQAQRWPDRATQPDLTVPALECDIHDLLPVLTLTDSAHAALVDAVVLKDGNA